MELPPVVGELVILFHLYVKPTFITLIAYVVVFFWGYIDINPFIPVKEGASWPGKWGEQPVKVETRKLFFLFPWVPPPSRSHKTVGNIEDENSERLKTLHGCFQK